MSFDVPEAVLLAESFPCSHGQEGTIKIASDSWKVASARGAWSYCLIFCCDFVSKSVMKSLVLCFARINLLIFHFLNVFGVCILVRVRLAGTRLVAFLEAEGSCRVVYVQAGFQGNLRGAWKPPRLCFISCQASRVAVRTHVSGFPEEACSDGDTSVHPDKGQAVEGQRAVWTTPLSLTPPHKRQRKVDFFLLLTPVLQDVWYTWGLLRAAEGTPSKHQMLQNGIVLLRNFIFCIAVAG